MCEQRSDLPRLSYSVSEAAQVIGVSGWTVRQWIAQGVLGRIPHTGRVRIAVVEVERFVAMGVLRPPDVAVSGT